MAVFNGTIEVRENPVTSAKTYSHTFPRSAGAKDSGYSDVEFSHRADGGYYRARFMLKGPRAELSEFMNDGLGREVVILGNDGKRVWEGYVHKMEYDAGRVAYSADLGSLSNSVWLRYRVRGASTTSRSTTQTDTDSIANYGTKQFILSGGELESSAVADSIALQYLNNHKAPSGAPTRIDPEKELAEFPTISVECRGWFDTLNWCVYNQTTSTDNQGASGQIDDIIVTPTPNPVSTLQNTLISWWALDEASGTRVDSHGSNDLADNNTVLAAAGKQSNAADLEFATSEYLDIADNATLSMGDIDFTIAVWVKAESLAAAAHKIITKGTNDVASGVEYEIDWLQSSNRFRFFVADGTNFGIAVANTLGNVSVATWYFIVAVHDSVNNLVKISVNNGAFDSVSNPAGGAQDLAGNFYIGREVGTAFYWDGLIDEVGIWKRVLSSDEISSLYNSGAGLAYTDITSAAALTYPTGSSQFVKSKVIQTNASLVSKEYDADRRGGDIVADIARLGDASGNRWLAYMDDDREFIYEPARPPLDQD